MPESIATSVTTSSQPAKPSILDSPDLDAEFTKALQADGKAQPCATPPAAPAAKAEEKTATTKVEDDTPADIKSEAGKSSWRALKDSKAAIEKERDELRGKFESANKRIEEMEKAAKTPAQQARLEDNPEYQSLKKLVDAKEKELNDYSERLRLTNVEQHPRFQEYFKNKTDAAMGAAKSAAGDRVVEVLKLPAGEFRDSQLEEIISELPQLKQVQLGNAIFALQQIEAERAGEIAKARENYQTIMAEQTRLQERQQAETRGVYDRVKAELTDKEKGLPVFQERAGDEEWNKGVRERLALIDHSLAGKLAPEDFARQMCWATAAPALLQQLTAVTAEKDSKIASLEKQITELRAVSPRPGETTTTATTTGASAKKGLDGLMETLENSGALIGQGTR